MSTALRKLARQYEDVMQFCLTYQRVWRHTPGTGMRELARIWYRVNS